MLVMYLVNCVESSKSSKLGAPDVGISHTRIDVDISNGRIKPFSVAQKMCWASHR